MITIWDNPEWRVLFDVTRLERVKPWQVRLAEIIESLMKELKKIGIMDFHSCGVAAYSAATIHRMKTERLLKFDIPRTPKERPNMTTPPPINLPLIPDFMITTMNELIEALQNLLARSRREKVKEERPPLEGFDVKFDEFLVKLEEELEGFISSLRERFRDREFIILSELIEDGNRLEIARRFILLLFTAARGLVEFIHDDEMKLIGVRWIGGSGRA
ncbi:MAG: hypothetical protein DRN64_04590 [Thaumarchaeota archaeon]|nr:MAG: hypothetical protein DRN64_04590 [Nitrososphaerota archaeon]